jgi:membrane dipeptidase
MSLKENLRRNYRGFVARKQQINIPHQNGAVDAGHQDWSAYSLNTNTDLRQQNILGVRHQVLGTENYQSLQIDLPSAIGRVKLFMGAAFVAPVNGDFTMPEPQSYLAEHERHDQVYNDLVDSKSELYNIRTVEDLWSNTHDKNAMGLMKSVEGLYVDEQNYREVINTLKERGVVSIGPMWNFDSLIGCTTKPSVRDESPDTGLTPFGREVIQYIDEKDMIVDLSHASDKTIDEVLSIESQNPRIFTHSASREICGHNRNVTDSNAKKIVDSGGVIGIPFVGTFIAEDKDERTVSRVVDHIQHFKDLGILHGIMIGSDFNGTSDGAEIEGLQDVTVAYENLRKEMAQREFTQREINMVLYRNATDFWLKHLPSERPPEEPLPRQHVIFPKKIINKVRLLRLAE